MGKSIWDRTPKQLHRRMMLVDTAIAVVRMIVIAAIVAVVLVTMGAGIITGVLGLLYFLGMAIPIVVAVLVLILVLD